MSSFKNVQRVLRAAVCIVASAPLFASIDANAQGISYTLAPAAASLSWDKELGLKNHSLYGGQAAIDFERLISLQGYYLTNDKINTAVDQLGLGGTLGSQLRNQRVQVRSMGANVIWKFWPGGIAPFIKTGGGIIELRPDSGSRSRQIALNLGGGLRFGANAPLFLDLFAEDMMLRVDRYALFSQGSVSLPVDARANDLRHNLLIGAAVGIPLGLNMNDRERETASRFQWGLTGASLTLEPFAGRLQFDDKGTNGSIGDQDLAGLRAGVDIGRYVGVRGFYWRSTDDNFKRLSSLQSWGGELQFRLNSSQGLTPYLLMGAAQLDFRTEDSTALSRQGRDKASLLLGGGVALPFNERIALNLSARDYLYGQGNGADSVSSPSDLRNNWMYSIGLRISIAGRSGTTAARREVARNNDLRARLREDSMRYAARDREEDAMRDDSTANGSSRNRSQNDRMQRERALRNRTDTRQRLITDDSVTGTSDSVRVSNSRAGSVITVPVPTVGEFYVRYGAPQNSATTIPAMPRSPADSANRRGVSMGSMSTDELRALVRDVVRDEMGKTTTASAADSARIANMSYAEREAYNNRRIDSIVTARVNEQAANLRAAAAVAQPTVVAPTAPPTVVVPSQQVQPVVQPQQIDRYRFVGNDRRGGLMVYTGATVNSGAQIALGARFDLGPINPTSSIDFAPEIAIGGGSGGRSTMIAANLQYLFRKFRVGTNTLIQPHVMAGIGILNFSDQVGSRDGLQGVINFGYGLSIPLTRNSTSRAAPVITVEHEGIDFFQLNRLLVGLSWRL